MIGYGKVTARAVLARLVGQDALQEKAPDGAIASVVKRVFGAGGDNKIKVRGMDDMMVFRARCCNPIRGEKIVGYITRGKGVSVHAAVCPNVVNLLYDPERRIDVEWDKTADASPYTVRLRINVEDRRGILAEVTSRVVGHQHQHPRRRGDGRRRSARLDPHDGRDQGHETSRQGREVAEERGRRAGRGADATVSPGRIYAFRYATASISTRTARGSAAAWIVERAGAGAAK